MDFFRQLLFPGSGASAPDQPMTLAFEGLDTGWAVLLWLLIGASVAVAFLRRFPGVGGGVKWSVVGLRVLLVAILLILWVRPVFFTTVLDVIRPRFLVVVDDSGSMAIADQRRELEDRARLAIARGDLDPADFAAFRPSPAAGGNSAATAAGDHTGGGITRRELVAELITEGHFPVFQVLAERADLVFYRASELLGPATPMEGDLRGGLRQFLNSLDSSGALSPLGDHLAGAVDRHRGEPVAGLLLISDGASNAGRSLENAAEVLNRAGVPTHALAVGTRRATDLQIAALRVPRIGFVDEKVVVEARVQAYGLPASRGQARLLKEGTVVAEVGFDTPVDGEVQLTLDFTATEPGQVKLTLEIDGLPGEATLENNVREDRVSILDTRVRVFFVEQVPRWEYRYLLDFLQDDRRLALLCVMLDGDPSLYTLPNTPFVENLPNDPAKIFQSDIVLIGDVDPARLGPQRMEWIEQWVGRDGGSVVFVAGRRNLPLKYARTPFEPLLPVAPPTGISPEDYGKTSPQAKDLTRTRAGRLTPWFQLAPSTSATEAIWNRFTGVRWTAPVGALKPGAEVFLMDESVTPARPVIVRQNYGRGQVVYIGMEESYRWRSGFGGQHYGRIWGQILQSLAEERLAGASRQVQLQSAAPLYTLGETVTISGQLFQTDFTPLTVASVEGTLEYRGEDPTVPTARRLNIRREAGREGAYRIDVVPPAAGLYRFHTALDPEAAVEFEVQAPVFELAEISVQLERLAALTEATGGRLFREETLQELPPLVEGKEVEIARQKRLEVARSPTMLVLLLLVAGLEWILRRLADLK